MDRRIYNIEAIEINGLEVTRVIIDPHFEEKHNDDINDELILILVRELDGRLELPVSKSDKYSYFATLVEHRNKKYRLIWLLEDGALYVGVVNAFRDKRKGKS